MGTEAVLDSGAATVFHGHGMASGDDVKDKMRRYSLGTGNRLRPSTDTWSTRRGNVPTAFERLCGRRPPDAWRACLARDEQQWGAFDKENGPDAVELHTEQQPGDQDLLDVAASQTMPHDGWLVVSGQDVPNERPLAAVLG